jgi:hypothetical protein
MSSRYQEWLKYAFDHEVNHLLPEWYWEKYVLFSDSPVEMTELLSLTFRNAGKDLIQFTDAQVNQGIWYFGNGANYPTMMRSSEVPLPKRLEAIENIFYLYSDCFAKRCAEILGDQSEEGTPLNSSCYMFWDMSYLTCYEDNPEGRQMRDAALKVLEKILTINHRACREGALHGLSEFFFSCPEKMQKIVDDFLSKTKLDEKLLAYARKAREGNVQ